MNTRVWMPDNKGSPQLIASRSDCRRECVLYGRMMRKVKGPSHPQQSGIFPPDKQPPRKPLSGFTDDAAAPIKPPEWEDVIASVDP